VTQRKGRLIGAAIGALVLYVLLWVGVAQEWSLIAAMDRLAIDPLHRYGVDHPGWVTAWDVLCTVLGPGAFRVLTLVVIVIAFARRKPRTAMFLIVSVELSGLVTEAAKAGANRLRPVEAFVDAWGSAFPSGHALGVMVSVLALLTVALPAVRRPLRVWLVVAGVVVVLAIGIGRVVLNVHHPSDVLAGWALGYVWFAACVLAVPPAAPVTAADEIPAMPGSSP
jgi:undecaprenyl-diphosphatase